MNRDIILCYEEYIIDTTKETIKHVYQHFAAYSRLHEVIDSFILERGVSKGDAISSKEPTFKKRGIILKKKN